ncbi:MAG: hypothetical protein OHK0029_29910 [Armatimonadaceae bacterium]
MGPEQMALMIPIMALSIPIVAILAGTLTKHQKDMAEIKARMGNSDINSEIHKELKELRKEVAELRDTTTKFDLSFDAAISQLEQRVEHIEENRVEEMERKQKASPAAQRYEQAEPTVLINNRQG